MVLETAMLAIRTTHKPDVGASPAQLVYGEGIALPGEILGGQNHNSDETRRRQQHLMSNLRMEVERLQPQPTSAHREPRIYMPGNLRTATHVFVRRGGVNPPLTAPYEGPFRVADRNDQNFKVHIPGRGVEVVAISRIKPAHVPVDDDAAEQPQDLDEERPPSPRPPGRPPGVRTRIPEPTDRQTRQSTRNWQQPPSNSRTSSPHSSDSEPINSGASQPPATDERIDCRDSSGSESVNSGASQPPVADERDYSPDSSRSESINSGASQPPVAGEKSDEIPLSATRAPDPPGEPLAATPSQQQPDIAGPAVPTNPPQPIRRYFSTGGRFSKRPIVNISALTRTLIETIPEDNAAQPSLSRQLANCDLPSGGRVASPQSQVYRHPNCSQRRVSFNPFVAKR